MKYLISFLIFSTFSAFSCNKEEVPEYYFTCKINGKEYLPNSCANCLVVKLLGDTAVLLNANKGFEALGIGVIKTDKIPVSVSAYVLNENKQQRGSYDNSPLVDDIFRTDASYTGQLTITTLDKAKQVIAGTFSFQAYNPVQDQSVSITDGKFRLQYKTN